MFEVQVVHVSQLLEASRYMLPLQSHVLGYLVEIVVPTVKLSCLRLYQVVSLLQIATIHNSYSIRELMSGKSRFDS